MGYSPIERRPAFASRWRAPVGVEVGFGWSPDYEVRVLPLRWTLVAEHAAAMTGIAAADLRFEDVRPV